MAVLEIRDMDSGSEYFVATCSHINESAEIDTSAQSRIDYFRRMRDSGMKIKVAYYDGLPAGFLYLIPIEISPWGPIGRDLLVIPCLYILNKMTRAGVGRALLAAAEDEAIRAGRKGIVIIGYYHDFWFMPARFFEKRGYVPVDRRKQEALLFKRIDSSAETPHFLQNQYRFSPAVGKVVIDLFWNQFCQTSFIEARRVREVATEFGNSVLLNDYCADDPATLAKYQTPRGIFINGLEIGWGYEAPREGIREAISKALKECEETALTSRRASVDEYDGLFSLMYSEAAPYLEKTMELMQMTRRQFNQLFRTLGEVYSICWGGQSAGFYWIEQRGHILHIHGLIVRTEFQGQGIGSRILARLEEQYGDIVDAIEMGVHESNRRAIALYERTGYQIVKAIDHLGFIIMQKKMQSIQ
jgi:ribosomal protein S18 acetylase RimI-like enzyme